MTIFDAHCHIFNGEILRDLTGYIDYVDQNSKVNYLRYKNSINKTSPALQSVPEHEYNDWWNWIKEIGQILTDSPKQNNQFVLNSLNGNFSCLEPNINNYATIPLMMDINFIFDTPLLQGQSVPKSTLVLENSIQNQILDLQNLSALGNCYPFFAVDPRRVGVIDAVLNGDFITRKPGKFFGLKLYPRLGYHPLSDNLSQLYAYCANNGIPITTHCCNGGFPPWSTPSSVFCDPMLFEPVLKANPNLIIDFAHFGYGNLDWGKSIVQLMQTYPNVYSDLSCYTGTDDLNNFKTNFWNIPIVKERTMYGSDFDVFYFTKTDMDMNDYMQSFKNAFTSDEIIKMAVTLPPIFLNL